MSRPKSPFLLFVLLVEISLFLCLNPNVEAQVDHSSLQHMSEDLEWPMNASSLENELDIEGGLEESGESEADRRRTLYYYYRSSRRYYISYGALSANRIPCPPRSGRSYYTNNCQRTNRPVNPYTRGCSTITRCRR